MNIEEILSIENNKDILNDIISNRKDIIPFVGAGISKGCGLYSWVELLNELAKEYFTNEEIKHMERNLNVFDYADKIVDKSCNENTVLINLQNIIKNSKITYNANPYIIVNSFSDIIVTTNYDTILEDVSKNISNSHPLEPLIPSFKSQFNDAIQLNSRKLLKIHGTVEKISSIIITSNHYKKAYGVVGNRKKLAKDIGRLFSGKRLLFIGCSLEQDITMEILKEVLMDYEVNHYAIIHLESDRKKRVEMNDRLEKLGIIPVFYKKGEFKDIEKILYYLSRENQLIDEIKYFLGKNFDYNIQINKAIIEIVTDAFFETASKFPTLYNKIPDNLIDKFRNSFDYGGETEKREANLISVINSLFDRYIKIFNYSKSEEIKSCFMKNLEECILKNHYDDIFVKQYWSLSKRFNDSVKNFENVEHISFSNINSYVKDAINELQFSNTMSKISKMYAYEVAKELEKQFNDKIEVSLRVKMLNCIGAFSSFYKDYDLGIKCLMKCQELIKKKQEIAQNDYLLLARCFSNLALLHGYAGRNDKALRFIKLDIKLKKKYNESIQVYSKSLNTYALLLKETKPIESLSVYLENAKLKESFVKSKKDIENIAALATTVFNIGLVARDLELYELSYKYVKWASEIRFKLASKDSDVYFSALNVLAELEIKMNIFLNVKDIIDSLASRSNMPDSFIKLMGHQYYVVAIYHYNSGELRIAREYTERSLDEAFKSTESIDEQQVIKSRILLLKIAIKEQSVNCMEDGYELINYITNRLGVNAYVLIEVYRLMMSINGELDRSDISNRYSNLIVKYEKQLKMAKKDLLDYYMHLQRISYI